MLQMFHGLEELDELHARQPKTHKMCDKKIFFCYKIWFFGEILDLNILL